MNVIRCASVFTFLLTYTVAPLVPAFAENDANTVSIRMKPEDAKKITYWNTSNNLRKSKGSLAANGVAKSHSFTIDIETDGRKGILYFDEYEEPSWIVTESYGSRTETVGSHSVLTLRGGFELTDLNDRTIHRGAAAGTIYDDGSSRKLLVDLIGNVDGEHQFSPIQLEVNLRNGTVSQERTSFRGSKRDQNTGLSGVYDCGSSTSEIVEIPQGKKLSPRSANSCAPGIVEVALDADYEFYRTHGEASETILSHLLAAAATFYRPMGIELKLVGVHVFKTPNQPYTSSASSVLLQQFSSYRESRKHLPYADVYHLVSGKTLDVLGLANIAAVCKPARNYGVSGVLAGVPTYQIIAHEIGHQLGAQHDAGSGYLMSASFRNSGPAFSPMSHVEIISLTSSPRARCVGLEGAGEDEIFIPYLGIFKTNDPVAPYCIETTLFNQYGENLHENARTDLDMTVRFTVLQDSGGFFGFSQVSSLKANQTSTLCSSVPYDYKVRVLIANETPYESEIVNTGNATFHKPPYPTGISKPCHPKPDISVQERTVDGVCSAGAIDCAYQVLGSRACVGANGFLNQINIATVINSGATPIQALVEYKDLQGVTRGQANWSIAPGAKQDTIINDIGLLPDTYGTVCVSTNATGKGAWTGGVTIYKPDLRRGSLGFGVAFDAAAYHPFTLPLKGKTAVPINTFHLGTHPDAPVANWISLSDAAPGNGFGVSGVLTVYDQGGAPVASERLAIPDGGRVDSPGHDRLTRGLNIDAVGTAVFEPDTTPDGKLAEYHLTLNRYFYDFPYNGRDILASFNIPFRPLTNQPIYGGVSTKNGELSVIELSNASPTPAVVDIAVFNTHGFSAGTTQQKIPPMGTVHVIVNKNGNEGFLPPDTIGMAQVTPRSGTVSAMSVFYRLNGSKMQYAYMAPFLGSGWQTPISQFNSFIEHRNEIELYNTTTSLLPVEVSVVNFNGAVLAKVPLELPPKSASILDNLGIPSDAYGVVRIKAPRDGIVFRNYNRRDGQYTIPFSSE